MQLSDNAQRWLQGAGTAALLFLIPEMLTRLGFAAWPHNLNEVFHPKAMLSIMFVLYQGTAVVLAGMLLAVLGVRALAALGRCLQGKKAAAKGNVCTAR